MIPIRAKTTEITAFFTSSFFTTLEITPMSVFALYFSLKYFSVLATFYLFNDSFNFI